MFSYGRQISTIRIVRTYEDPKISKFAIALAIVLMVSLRFGLDPGIEVNAFPKKMEKPLEIKR
jgi:hypothetical protein